MAAVFSQLIAQLNSSVFVLLGLLALAGLALFKLGAWKEKFFHHDRRLDKIESIHDKVIELSTKVQLIYDNTNPRKLIDSHSPLAVTALGKQISENIRGNELFAKYRDRLLEFLNANCPQDANAYDIQVAALEIAKYNLEPLLNAEEINRLKQEAFNKGILLEDLWGIFGIYLRDYALDARGIPVSEVDKYNPQKN